MSFVDEPVNARERRSAFFDFTPGDHLIRVLEPKARSELIHWYKNAKIKCLGDGCPICALGDKHRPTKSYSVNVLDLTDVKICKSCHAEIKPTLNKYPKVCPKCESSLEGVTPVPNNKVVILSGGTRLFVEQLNSIYNEYGDLRDYNLDLLVSGTGRDRQIMVRPSKDKTEVKIDSLELHDLSRVSVELTKEEMERFINSDIRISDIYQARNESSSTKDNTEKINKLVNELFS